MINKAIDGGMIKVIESDILPRLDKDPPILVATGELQADPLLHRFTLVATGNLTVLLFLSG